VYAALNLMVDLTCTGLFYLKNLRSGDLFVEEDYLQEGDLEEMDEEEQVNGESDEDEEIGDEKNGGLLMKAISVNDNNSSINGNLKSGSISGKGHSSPQSSPSHTINTSTKPTTATATASTCTHCSSTDSNASSPSTSSTLSSVKRRAKKLWIRCAKSSDNLLQKEVQVPYLFDDLHNSDFFLAIIQYHASLFYRFLCTKKLLHSFF